MPTMMVPKESQVVLRLDASVWREFKAECVRRETSPTAEVNLFIGKQLALWLGMNRESLAPRPAQPDALQPTLCNCPAYPEIGLHTPGQACLGRAIEETVIQRLQRLAEEQEQTWEEAVWRATLEEVHIDPDAPALHVWREVENCGFVR